MLRRTGDRNPDGDAGFRLVCERLGPPFEFLAMFSNIAGRFIPSQVDRRSKIKFEKALPSSSDICRSMGEFATQLHSKGAIMHAILVDLDGTIVNSGPGIIGSYQHALRYMGVECPSAEDLTWVIGPPSRRSFPKLIRPDQDVEEAVRLYRDHYAEYGIFNGTIYPGMQEALSELYALPARLFVCTAKVQSFAERIIEHFGLAHLFERVYGADPDGKFDDKGLLIEHIMGVEQIEPSRMVMIGDRANDMLAAARHAIPGVGALWGYGDEAELMEAGATILSLSPHDLAATVRGLLHI
jgi:phosphoglycolate phosphatase